MLLKCNHRLLIFFLLWLCVSLKLNFVRFICFQIRFIWTEGCNKVSKKNKKVVKLYISGTRKSYLLRFSHHKDLIPLQPRSEDSVHFIRSHGLHLFKCVFCPSVTQQSHSYVQFDVKTSHYSREAVFCIWKKQQKKQSNKLSKVVADKLSVF